MKRLDARLAFKMTDIDDAIVLMEKAKAAGFSHAVVSVSKYIIIPPKVKDVPVLERGGVPGRIHLNGTPGKVRSLGT